MHHLIHLGLHIELWWLELCIISFARTVTVVGNYSSSDFVARILSVDCVLSLDGEDIGSDISFGLCNNFWIGSLCGLGIQLVQIILILWLITLLSFWLREHSNTTSCVSDHHSLVIIPVVVLITNLLCLDFMWY